MALRGQGGFGRKRLPTNPLEETLDETLASTSLCNGSPSCFAARCSSKSLQRRNSGVTGFRSEVLAEVMIRKISSCAWPERFRRISIRGARFRSAVDGRGVLTRCHSELQHLSNNWRAPPAGFDGKNFEKSTTDKTKIVAALKDRLLMLAGDHAMPDADLEKSMDWSAGRTRTRSAPLRVRHGAEHLGRHCRCAGERCGAALDGGCVEGEKGDAK